MRAHIKVVGLQKALRAVISKPARAEMRRIIDMTLKQAAKELKAAILLGVRRAEVVTRKEKPVHTLRAAAKLEYWLHINDLNLSKESAREHVKNDLAIVVGLTNPEGEPSKKSRQYYNAITDVLWHWSDVSDRHEPLDYQWTRAITRASENSPILRVRRATALFQAAKRDAIKLAE